MAGIGPIWKCSSFALECALCCPDSSSSYRNTLRIRHQQLSICKSNGRRITNAGIQQARASFPFCQRSKILSWANNRFQVVFSLSNDQVDSDLGNQPSTVIEANTPLDTDSVHLNGKITVEELMQMVKDAEKNILMLNQIRTRAMADLNKVRSNNESLQGQTKVLKARLAESDAKLQLAEQSKLANEKLQKQIESLHEKVKIADKLEIEAAELKERLEESLSRVMALEEKSKALEQLQEKEQSLLEEVSELQQSEQALKLEAEALRGKSSQQEEDFEKQLSSLEEIRAKQQRELKGLEEKAAEMESQLKALAEAEGVRDSLKSQVLDLERKLAEQGAQEANLVEGLEKERDESKGELKALKLNLMEQEKSLFEAQERLSAANQTVTELLSVKELNLRLEEQAVELKSAIVETEKANLAVVGKMQEEREECERKIINLNSTVADREGKLAELNSQLEETARQVERLSGVQEANQGLEGTVAELKNSMKELTNAATESEEKLREERDSAVEEVNSLRGVMASLQEEIEGLNEKLSGALLDLEQKARVEEKCTELEGKISEMERQIAEKQAEQEKLSVDFSAEKSALLEESAKLHSLVEEQTSRVSTLEGNLRTDQERMEKLEEELKDALAGSESKQKLLEQREDRITELIGAVKVLEGKGKELEEEKSRAETLAAELRTAEEKASRIEIEEAEKVARLEEECKAMEQKAEEMKQQLAQYAAILEEMEVVKAEKSILEANLTAVEGKVEELSGKAVEVERLQKKLSLALTELNQLSKKEGLLDKMQDEKRNLEKQLERMRMNQGDGDEVRKLNQRLTMEMGGLERSILEKDKQCLKLAEELTSLQNSAAQGQELRARVMELEEKAAEAVSVKQQKVLLEVEYSKLQESLNDIEQVNLKRKNLEVEFEKLKPRLAEAKHMQVEKEKLEKEVQKLKMYLREAEKVAAEMWRLEQEVACLELELKKSAKLRQEKMELENRVKELEAENGSADKALKQKAQVEREVRRLTELLREFEEVKRERSRLQLEVVQLVGVAERGEKVEQEKTRLAQELKKLQVSLSRMDQVEREKARLEKEVQRLQVYVKRSEELQREKSKLEQDINRLNTSVTRVEVLQKERSRMDQDMSSLRERLAESEETARDKATLDKEVQRLQANLRSAEAVRKEKGVLEQEVRKLQALVDRNEAEKSSMREKLEREIRSLQSSSNEAEKLKNLKSQLEGEVKQLKGVLSNAKSSEAEKAALQGEVSRLQGELASAEKARKQNSLLEQGIRDLKNSFNAEKKVLEEGLKRLQNSLTEEKNRGEVAAVKAMAEAEGLRQACAELELSLVEASKKEEELANTRDRCQALEKEVKSMRDIVDQSRPLKKAAEEVRKKNQLLQESLKELESMVAEAEGEREAWKEGERENVQLKERVGTLTGQLADSDRQMQEQVEHFRVEMEGFQTRVEVLAKESSGGVQVPVGEMTWDFWSELMLRLDDLLLTQRLSLEEAQELRLMTWQRNSRIRDAYVSLEAEPDAKLERGLKDLIKAKVTPGLHIVHIAAEMAPVAKVGGLADVVTGLGRALQKKGHLVEVILPKYDCMDYSRVSDLKVLEFDLPTVFEGEVFNSKVWRGIVEGLPVYFIEPLHPAKLFWRGCFYGEADDLRRFSFFCRAALDFLGRAGRQPQVLHCHDWQTALVAPLFWELYQPAGVMASAHVAFTCHNFEYQGTGSPNELAAVGLDVPSMFRQDRMQDNFQLDRINLLKGGFVFSNLITTVSPTYAMEVRGPEGGRGLQGTLASCSSKFQGVLNGIDFEAWDPLADSLLAYRYDASCVERKYANKATLRKTLGLESCLDGDKPLVGCVTRLVPQKGVHLIRHAIFRTRDQGGQFVLLGSSPVPEIQRDFENLAREFSSHPDIRLVLKYDEALSHAIYAACDILVIPSIFEPCGLTQLIAMRYGAIPVVRKTGGLADSVFDVDDANIPEAKKNGFTFTATDEDGLNYALDRALGYYYNHPEWWQDLVVRAMNMDFSWEESSQKYVDLYEKIILGEI